ncbi:MAG TPA: ribosomal protein S18-alanine N-acetyltransferase [Rudaea sp.]|jgi:ribosomal-protein-alanine N-acetyltransferase|nr:ribosomal protein S18-alanine N-acetyltransferase [Rudaea sp.]
MIDACEIRLAMLGDAERIAVMSRDFIEHGLGWNWDAARVARRIRQRETNVVVAESGAELVGFGLMQYLDDQAHLLLFGVEPIYRRLGIGSGLLSWLESCAITAGIELIFLESRASNTAARAFYGAHGYRELAVIPRYYSGREDAIRMGKDMVLAGAGSVPR